MVGETRRNRAGPLRVLSTSDTGPILPNADRKPARYCHPPFSICRTSVLIERVLGRAHGPRLARAMGRRSILPVRRLVADIPLSRALRIIIERSLSKRVPATP